MLIYYLTGQPLEQERVILFIIVSVVMGATTNAIGFCFGTLLNFNVRNHTGFFLYTNRLPCIYLKIVGEIFDY